MKSQLKYLPYVVITLVAIIFFTIACYIENRTYWTIAINIGSSAFFVLIAYLFYDLVKSNVKKKEKKELDEYIKNRIETDSLVVLYYFKKILHGYNLDTNSLTNIVGIQNYSEYEIRNSVSNQSFLGFQIFKQIDGLRDLFTDVLNDNLFLKHSSYLEDTNLVKINNLLYKIELLLKNSQNFTKCAEQGVDYITVNAKEINPMNNDDYLLLRRTPVPNRFVVHDSGSFNKEDVDSFLNMYVLKPEIADLLAKYIFELLSLLKYWMPQIINLPRQEKRFRIIDKYFSEATGSKTTSTKIHVADIVDLKGDSKGKTNNSD